MPIQTLSLADAAFRGIDQYNHPSQIHPPLSQVMDGLNIQGGDDDGIGIAELREGKQGILAAALANPIYLLDSYTDSSGVTGLLYTSNGHLYRINPASATAGTEILLSGSSVSLASATSYAERVGAYEYLVDSVAALKRADMSLATPTAALVSLMTRPVTPKAALSSTLLDATTSSTVWSGFNTTLSSSAELLTNTSFETGTPAGGGTLTPITGWTAFGLNADAQDGTYGVPAYSGTYSLLLDDPGEGVKQTTATLPTMTASPLSAQKVRLYFFTMQMHNSDPTGRSTVIVQFDALTSGGAILSTIFQECSQPYDAASGSWKLWELPVSFTAAACDTIDTIQVSLFAGAANPGSHVGCYVDVVSLKPVPVSLIPSVGGLPSSLSASTSVVMGGASKPALAPKIGGQWLRRTFASTLDFTPYNIISMRVTLAPSSTVGGSGGRPRFRFGFANTTDTAVSWTNPCTYSDDGTFISVDTSTVSAASGGARQACKYFYVQVMDDLDDGATFFPFAVQDITAAGNLSVGYASYTWALVECDATTDATVLINIIESPESGYSNSLDPTLQQASANITLGARQNGTTNTYWKLFRAGGTFNDRWFRLVAMEAWSQATFAFGADTAKGTSPYYAAPANPYVSFTSTGTGTTGDVLYDSTPDSFLLNAELLPLGREAAPVGATSICEWGGRLWLSVGRFVYGSHLLTGNKSAGVYFQTVPLPDSPNFESSGIRITIGGDDTDTVVRLIVLHDRLIALRKRGVPYLVTGTSPLDFAERPDDSGTATGCTAPRAAQVWHGQLIYMAAQGLMAYNGIRAVKFSLLLQKLLVPQLSGGTALLPASVAQNALFSHGESLYLSAPTILADTTPTCLFHLNGAENGWTRYPSMSITSGVSALDGTDKYSLYVGEVGGQISKFVAGVGDKALSGSSTTAKSFEITTRAMGQELSRSQEERSRQKVGTRLFAEFENGAEAVTLTITVTNGDNGSARVITYTLPAGGGVTVLNKSVNGVRGRTLIIDVTGAAKLPFNIRHLGLEAALGGF